MQKHSRPCGFVSIILPTYNRAYCLDRTIQAVLDQTYENWELIVIDNHSTDLTIQLIESYHESRIKVVSIHNHGNIAASRNKGLREAQGQYLAFLDSDDWWRPDKLEKSLRALETGADFVYHHSIVTREDATGTLHYKRVNAWQVRSPVFEDLLLNGNPICCSSVVVRKCLFDKIGGFSEEPELIATEDYDAWLRLARQTEKFYRLNEYLVYYSWGCGNMSNFQKVIVNSRKLIELYAMDAKGAKVIIPFHLSYNLAKAYFKQKMRYQCIDMSIKTLCTGLFSVPLRRSLVVTMVKSMGLLIMSILKLQSCKVAKLPSP